MMSVQEIIETFSNEDGLQWGINTVMSSLRPGCLYSLEAAAGQFIIREWPDNQWDDVKQCYIDAPTSQEIQAEYARQQTIAECVKYFKNKEIS